MANQVITGCIRQSDGKLIFIDPACSDVELPACLDAAGKLQVYHADCDGVGGSDGWFDVCVGTGGLLQITIPDNCCEPPIEWPPVLPPGMDPPDPPDECGLEDCVCKTGYGAPQNAYQFDVFMQWRPAGEDRYAHCAVQHYDGAVWLGVCDCPSSSACPDWCIGALVYYCSTNEWKVVLQGMYESSYAGGPGPVWYYRAVGTFATWPCECTNCRADLSTTLRDDDCEAEATDTGYQVTYVKSL